MTLSMLSLQDLKLKTKTILLDGMEIRENILLNFWKKSLVSAIDHLWLNHQPSSLMLEMTFQLRKIERELFIPMVDALEIVLNSTVIDLINITSIQIYLQDPGKDIKFIFLEGYDTIHNLDISDEEKLEHNSKTNGKDYDDGLDDYANCYGTEIVFMFQLLLNCTHP